MFTTWIDASRTRQRTSSGGRSRLSFFSWEKWLNNFLWHKLIASNIHISNPNSLQSHSGTDEVIHLWSYRVTKTPLFLCKHMHSYIHNRIYTCLPVRDSREQTELNSHVASLSARGSGAFIIRSPSHSSKPENSKSCCVVTKSPLTLWVELTRRIRPGSGWGRQVFLAGMWRIWIAKRDIWLAENCKTYFKRWKDLGS